MMSQNPPPEITAFVADLRRHGMASTTIDIYTTDLASFARWYVDSTGEAFSAQAVSPSDLVHYMAHLSTAQRLQAATINRRLAALRKFFGWAKGTGRITNSPIEAVKGVPQPQRVPRTLAIDEGAQLLLVAGRDGNKRNRAILLVLLLTGLRVGELCNLRLGDIEIAEPISRLLVRSSKRRTDHIVPLGDLAKESIMAYLAIRPQVADDHLFIGQRGDPLQAEAVQMIVKKYAAGAGLVGVTPQILRHTLANMSRVGLDLEGVSRFLDHKRVETTAIYPEPTTDDIDEMNRRIDEE